jgi:hypothetical protein
MGQCSSRCISKVDEDKACEGARCGSLATGDVSGAGTSHIIGQLQQMTHDVPQSGDFEFGERGRAAIQRSHSQGIRHEQNDTLELQSVPIAECSSCPVAYLRQAPTTNTQALKQFVGTWSQLGVAVLLQRCNNRVQ